MKNTVLSFTLLAVLAIAAVGCHKDQPIVPDQPVTRHINYIECGIQKTITVTSDDEWHSLLNNLFDAAESGCSIAFWDADMPNDTMSAKETVTYSTAVRDSAYRWGERMYDYGYTVSVYFDRENNKYVCSAVKMTVVLEYQQSFTTQLHMVIGSEEMLVINSQEQFDSIFPNCNVPIYVDFETQSLIATWGIAPSTVWSTDTRIEYNNEVGVIITIVVGDGDHPDSWDMAVTCSPKISAEQPVSLIVNYR